MTTRSKRALCVTGAILGLAFSSLNLLGYRLAKLDSISGSVGFAGQPYRVWETAAVHLLRGRVSRLCIWPPNQFVITATACTKDSREVESKIFPQHGGSSISVPVSYVATAGCWHYYLPHGWPGGIIVSPYHAGTLPECYRHSKPNRVRYISIEDGGYIRLSASR